MEEIEEFIDFENTDIFELGESAIRIDKDEDDIMIEEELKKEEIEEIEEFKDELPEKDLLNENDINFDLLKENIEIKNKNKNNEKKEYLDDVYVTKVLLRDIKNEKMSEELGEIFKTIQRNIFKKHNFIGYYGYTKELMEDNSNYLFMKNWNKFKIYRVRNNFLKKGDTKIIGEYLSKTNKIKIKKNDIKLEEYDLLIIDDKSYNIDKFKISENYIEIELKNKLKNDIKDNTDVSILNIKEDNKELKGGFSFITMLVFTGAKMALNKMKQKEENFMEIDGFIGDVIQNENTIGKKVYFG